ncbi:MAG: hypothetical protein FWD46_08395 [Cystobacterineae bacterium]|nr:hypothetical protein [Cystobacterineae bacterium]
MSASDLPSFRIRKVTESEIETLISKIGGKPAHPDANERSKAGADFVLGSSVIELKILEEEGMEKRERQQKLAKLFRERFPQRPTIVLDRELLNTEGQREYDKIMEGPIKTEVSHARKQLKQSRSELNVSNTVLWVINNGYTSLSHDALMESVARRARNDSTEIDTVVVSGAYFYSDSFESFVIWPIDCSPINLDKPFEGFKALQIAWARLASDYMTALIREPPVVDEKTKGPIIDLSFKLDEIAYVMPTPPMGRKSDFFVHGRPRKNSTGITVSPPVATVFAGLSQSEWTKFKRCNPLPVSFVDHCDYSEWKAQEARARSESPLKPFITTPVTCAGWKKWKRQLPKGANNSIHRYATDLFQEKILSIIEGARERTNQSVLPHRYMLLITEEIGQDLAFDVSHLFEVCTLLDGNDHLDEVWTDKPMFFEQARCVAAAEAIARDVEFVFWEKDKTYAWT